MTGRTRIDCLSCVPVEVGDLDIVGIQEAKAIVILSPEAAVADAGVI
jgi:hypothetical protein